MPLTTTLRDSLKFEPILFDVLEVYTSGAADVEPITCKVGTGELNVSTFLEATVHKAAHGRPRVEAAMPIQLSRVGTPLEKFCVGETGSPDVESVTTWEDIELVVKVALNEKQGGSEPEDASEEKKAV